ncbi:MAG: YraN family protein [Pseudomonadota bacterium]
MSFLEPTEGHRTSTNRKSLTGAQSHFRGVGAEDSVVRWYKARGGDILERRWRGREGEIDLIVRHEGVVVFCEVKSSKNRQRAAASLSDRQIKRICQAAAEFLGTLPDGELTKMRFDFAIVDSSGAPDVIHNAFDYW